MKFLLICVLSVFAHTLQEHEYRHKFNAWTREHSKNYTSGYKWADAYEKFKSNVDKINAHNAKNLGWTMKLNKFGDMNEYDWATFIRRGNGGGFTHVEKLESEKNYGSPKGYCDSVDWVAKGAVTPVKNQGQCGSCWSFSTTGGIEGRVQIATGQLVSLSEQQLVDCDKVDQACNGGLMDYGFSYVVQNDGLCSEDEYPYDAMKGTCKKNTCGTKYGQISSHQDVEQNQASLQSALCDGPVSVAIQANQNAFQFYSGGVMSGSCGTELDHGVLAVGFGTDNGQAYWKIKNSWGPSWGEQGYIRLCKGDGCAIANGDYGQCGLAKSASYPVV